MTDATPRTGDLLYSEIEEDLRASVRALLEKRSPWDAVLARTESAETTDRELWALLAGEIGCAALAVPEAAGGAGASWRETAVVAEELGRAVAPVPFLGSAGIAVALLLALDQRDLLSGIADGSVVAAVAVPFATPPGAATEWADVSGDRISGVVRGVADAAVADIFLVPTADALYVVDAEAPGLRRTEIVSLDMTRPLVDLVFDGVPARRLAAGAPVSEALTAALRIGAVLLASEQLGVAERCFAMTVQYLTLRRQFGRILGSYQALKHRVADLWVLITQAKAAARYAAECAATASPDLPVAASLAQAHCSTVAQQAAEECVQLHGGIGFTWEHPAHLYLKRAKSSAIALGTPERHRTTLAGLVNIPLPALNEGS
ncbi:acyl-CoA dehydrogenase family protein [Amycolatopsis thermoflava]|uniref:Alkylation response protein AidB-like acyl-CoA dehydrogenase n=1 Tax=Amycolatopsis thermoflava TaxID=84480 RepID=A0A3N2G6X5_9PSEU|nr:acyl-CoA dehydrogenase family protein [Amycolatopsis thermoflava]ROS32160.1 alkylation response protein AidB-like acyl-CoA dehydrogenase [Amycolatopsis thermoflava]